jgi:two-component system sensor histidine kinase KdpD
MAEAWDYNVISMDLPPQLRSPWIGMAVTAISTVLVTAALAPFHDEVGLLVEGLLLLFITLVISATWGRGVGIFAALVTNLALNFFFVEPLHRLTVQDPQNIAALLLFLVVSLVGSSLLVSARTAAERARRKEAETHVLLSLSRTMIGRTEPEEALAALCREVVAAFEAPGASVLSPAAGGWRVLASAGSNEAGRPPDAQERMMADRAASSGVITRFGDTGLSRTRRVRIIAPSGTERVRDLAPGSSFVPLRVGDSALGVLRLDGPIGDTPFRDHPDSLLTAFAGEAALGVQRSELAHAAAHADALKQADEMKSALMTSISHDLKTPLAGIKTAVSSLLDNSVQWSDEDKAAFLETIDSQADRLNRVISDILDLNRIESGVIAPALRPIGVRALLEDARDRTALYTRPRVVTVDASSDAFVLADESLIIQALVNLIENAAKYSTPTLPIHLDATMNGAAIEIVVGDEGPGIAAGDLPHVFERFYRAQEGSRRVKGSGLGLAIVKGFVTLCGGTVRVDSAPTGTQFTITLPAAVPAEAPAVPEKATA